MFGLSFGEFVVLLGVAMVVLGPKELPRYLRKAGLFAGRMRRLAFEMREKSGIDEVLRSEGIDRDIAEIRRLTRGELTSVAGLVRSTANAARIDDAMTSPYNDARPVYPPEVLPAVPAVAVVDRDREYPSEGPDAYGALPDGAVVYDGSLAPSPLADDPVYTQGEASTTPSEARS